MLTVAELQRWLGTVPEDSQIAVDEGGLTLVVVGDEGVYLEVGGVPDDAERAAS
jgi:hypothetical protein